MSEALLSRLREICAGLPEAAEGVTVHHPNFNVRGKSFVIVPESDQERSAWIKSTLGEQQELVAADPQRFFVPPYVGRRGGWIGVRLGGTDETAADGQPPVDWDEIAELVTDGYRLAAPKRLVRQLDEG